MYSCSNCNKKYVTEKKFKEHCDSHQRDPSEPRIVKMSEIKLKPPKIKRSYYCDHCKNKGFNSENSFFDHMVKHHPHVKEFEVKQLTKEEHNEQEFEKQEKRFELERARAKKEIEELKEKQKLIDEEEERNTNLLYELIKDIETNFHKDLLSKIDINKYKFFVDNSPTIKKLWFPESPLKCTDEFISYILSHVNVPKKYSKIEIVHTTILNPIYPQHSKVVTMTTEIWHKNCKISETIKIYNQRGYPSYTEENFQWLNGDENLHEKKGGCTHEIFYPNGRLKQKVYTVDEGDESSCVYTYTIKYNEDGTESSKTKVYSGSTQEYFSPNTWFPDKPGATVTIHVY